ncbi:guanine deaminase [Shimia haliotis]|uniref:Guanine deaminase n=1 Tax=Shimia haliotis TaxID=1280847 RepID=A0A1I4FQ40_9RHOB|nr:guanine deaminase [Shimia haliotis]SFL18711.1 guanine deaminase [Shimia haliotis]
MTPTEKYTLLRGRVLDFHSRPEGEADTAAYRYIEDGAILMKDGKIKAVGAYCDVAAKATDAAVTDHRPNLLMAGFIDTHVHFPQVQVIASWGSQLLDWLNNYTFPEETRFESPVHCEAMAGHFYDLLLSHGTTTAVSFCSVHTASVDAYFSEAARRNMCMIGGKVMMDRNAPDALTDTPVSGYDNSKALIDKWHGKGRAHYAITPRFAITSTPEQMEMAGALVAEHPECFVQTHLSENHDEIAFTAELYPQAPDYLGVYESYGLLTPKTLLGHSIHLQPREIEVLAETQAKPVFCPTSNLFLGSGLFDDAGLRSKNIQNAIATDIGAGTSYSMLQTLNEGYKVLQLQNQKLHPLQAFHWITRGNAEVLGLADRIGTLEVGTDADIVVLNSRATPAMDLRMQCAETLSEELFVLQMLGDDRAIAETYVAGKAMKHTSGKTALAEGATRRLVSETA